MPLVGGFVVLLYSGFGSLAREDFPIKLLPFMFITIYGHFNGNTWEDMMQVIFKRKHMAAQYQRIMASSGDYGLEGFTRTGLAFQCYCPDVNSDNGTLYEKQRDKMTRDISKLHTNCAEIQNILGGVRIQSWILVTPRMGHRDLLLHCHTKRDLVKSWNLPFIDSDNFEVLVHEADDYAREIGDYFAPSNRRFMIVPEDTTATKIVEWKNTESDLVKNALQKNEVRVSATPTLASRVEIKTNELTDQTTKYYLNGESILRTWASSQPENHQRFIELLASLEEELKEKSMLNTVDPKTFIDGIAAYVETKIKEDFPFLHESTAIRLKNYCISFWLLTCPLYFETNPDA